MWCVPYHTAKFLETFVAKEFETDVLERSVLTEGTGREMQVCRRTTRAEGQSST